MFKDIPMRIIKNAARVYSHRLTTILNNCIRNWDILKYAVITSVFKKGDTTNKSNSWPICTLTNFSKIFEELIYSQVSPYKEPKLSKYLPGFCWNHNTQQTLLRVTELYLVLLNKGQKVGAIIMDLSTAFDTLNHKILLKKWQAYCFDKISLSFIESCFTNRKQRTKIGDSFSKYQRIITGVPQNLVLGPLLKQDFSKISRWFC